MLRALDSWQFLLYVWLLICDLLGASSRLRMQRLCCCHTSNAVKAEWNWNKLKISVWSRLEDLKSIWIVVENYWKLCILKCPISFTGLRKPFLFTGLREPLTDGQAQQNTHWPWLNQSPWERRRKNWQVEFTHIIQLCTRFSGCFQ